MERQATFFAAVIAVFAAAVLTSAADAWTLRAEQIPSPDSIHSDFACDVAVDDVGCVYVAGKRLVGGDFDYLVRKYDRQCARIVWTKTYDGGFDDAAIALTIQGDAVYVTGTSSNGADDDYLTIAYDCETGSEIWAEPARYNGPASGDDTAYGIAACSAGVYVTGFAWNGPLYTLDMATVRYDLSTGDRLDRAVPARLGNDYALAIAIGDDCSVVVTGTGLAVSLLDYVTFKYDSELTDTWGGPATYDGPGAVLSEDVAYAVAIDPSGDVYVTGRSEGFGGRSDFATLKYDGTTGLAVWSEPARYESPGDANDVAVAICLGADESVFVTGYEEPISRESQWSVMHTLRYRSSDGLQVWETEREHSYPRDMVVGADGAVAVAGQTWSEAGENWDYLTVKHSHDAGDVLWESVHAVPVDRDDIARGIAVFGSDLIVTGDSSTDSDSWIVTIRYPFGTEECDYVGRCLDDAYFEHNLSTPTYQLTERTSDVLDGAGSPDGGAVHFLMDMMGHEATYAGGAWDLRVYGFGLIVTYDVATCDAVSTVRLSEYSNMEPAAHYSGLAHDESDGTFWVSRPLWSLTCPPVPPTTLIVNVDESGSELTSYTVDGYGVVGLALDPGNSHLWCIARGDPDILLEYDVSVQPPVLIQGPLAVPWTQGSVGAAAGLDYDQTLGHIVAVDAAAGMKEVFQDLIPGYGGTSRDGIAGVAQISACALTATPGAWGIALSQEMDEALVAASGLERPRPIDVYEHPSGSGTSVRETPVIALRAPRVHPNPFNPSTRIEYELPVECHVTLTVHNLKGQAVVTLVDARADAGVHSVHWDAAGLASGVYFCRLSTGGDITRSKMVLLK